MKRGETVETSRKSEESFKKLHLTVVMKRYGGHFQSSSVSLNSKEALDLGLRLLAFVQDNRR